MHVVFVLTFSSSCDFVDASTDGS